MFNAVTYFQNLKNSLKLTKDKYHFSKVSGLAELEGIIQNRQYFQYHIAVDISEDGLINRGNGRGFFDTRPSTVFICAAISEPGNMDEKESMMEEFRAIYRAFVSKIIKDASDDELLQINTARFPYYEIPGEFAGGCVGIYFMFNTDNPINLIYNANDWE